MVFTSAAFIGFFVAFFIGYWFLCNRNLKLQNLFLLIGSYLFYAKADWHFLGLLIGSSFFNYFIGIGLDRHGKYHRWILLLGLIQGVGSLIYFKYCNFFIESFTSIFSAMGFHRHSGPLHILIPLGISFYTFRTISYILDIDKGKIKATRDWLVFFNYVAFFPCLLSGPIDKASLLIPQLQRKREFDFYSASDGMRQILWGVFKKLVIADNISAITGGIFEKYQSMPASSLWVAALLYTIQIYADFSGYSDMAIGISKLLGFNITRNFAYPLFAQNIAEFWRKWHISLTAWLTEYVFTPLSIAFRDWGRAGVICAIITNFTLIGIWHGANWTYVLFGFLHGCYFIPLILRGTMNKKRKFAKDQVLPNLRESLRMISVYVLVSLTFILFVSSDINQSVQFYRHLVSTSLFSIPAITTSRLHALTTIAFICIMLCIEWVQRNKEHGLQLSGIRRPIVRLAIYYCILSIIVFFGAVASNQFIYFKF